MMSEEEKNHLGNIGEMVRQLNLECLAYLQRFISEAIYEKSQNVNIGDEQHE